MSKRVLGILMSLVLVVMMFAGNAAFAAEGDVYIVSYEANNGINIDEGDDFNLSLTIQNNSNEDIEDVTVSFGAGAAFQPSSAGRDLPFSPIIPEGDDHTTSFVLFYTGASDKKLRSPYYTDSTGRTM